MRTHCYFCGQLLKQKRMGVELAPLKARIFDLVKDAGENGAASTDLLAQLPIRGEVERRVQTLNVHINQINAKMAKTGWRIIGLSFRKFLIKQKKKGLAKRVKT
jgi:hypothetical protein